MDQGGLLRTLLDSPIDRVAAVVAGVSAVCAWWGTRRALVACEAGSEQLALVWGVVAGGLAWGLTIAVLDVRCQETPEVRPGEWGLLLRPVFQASLVVLLVIATATDLRTYYILDSTTCTGIAIAVVAATLSGDLQMIHLWVDWNQEVPQLRGPYIPEWLANHPHLHGLAWSVAGLLVGGGVTWLARGASALVLGKQALGFGDVTLMAMIGAYLGWQPVLIVFLLAPLCAIVVGLPARLAAGRPYLPYGPFLALAAVLVLFTWRWIWMFEVVLSSSVRPGEPAETFALRRLFGDWVGLLILGGLVVGGIVLLLGAWRIYLSIPVATRSTTADAGLGAVADGAEETSSSGAEQSHPEGSTSPRAS
jgi:leader peptidase (prepilin peptidase)/N-methyltransferase